MTRSAPARPNAARRHRVIARCLRLQLPVPGNLTFLLLALSLHLCPGPASAADPARVTFSLDFPNSDPERYSISVNADGHATYDCSVRISPASEERQQYQTEFDLTPASRARIFELAAQAHYFSGKVDSGNSKIAFTGSKKLMYEDAQRSHSASYNYSGVAAVQQLTSMFQRIAATLDYGRRLAFYHHYQKLALDEELKRLEAQVSNNELSELQAVHQVLTQIIDDPSVMNVVRARAQRLVQRTPVGQPNP